MACELFRQNLGNPNLPDPERDIEEAVGARKPAWDLAKRTEEHMKGMVAPGTLFEELGWHYIGPLDGHDLPSLVEVLKRVSSLNGPQILHIRTIKGKGFTPAEEDPVGYHALGKIEPKKEVEGVNSSTETTQIPRCIWSVAL